MMPPEDAIKESIQMAMNTSLNATPRLVSAFLFSLAVFAMILITASCSMKKIQKSADSRVTHASPAQSRAVAVEKRILDEYRKWRGTRHKMGGSGSKGIDCSGFVKAIYRDAFSIELPRTTREQARLGKPLAFKELQPGDLVFFKPPTYPRHVGIFLSQSEFVHASKSKGVTISKIDPHYWGKYFWTARRILPDK
jgi:cell wall-associated NlpC family hydrolase